MTVLVVVIVAPGASQVTVTGSVPEVEHDCASAPCGLAIAATRTTPATAVVVSRVERCGSTVCCGHKLAMTARASPM